MATNPEAGDTGTDDDRSGDAVARGRDSDHARNPRGEPTSRPPTRVDLLFYAFCSGALTLFCKAFWRTTVIGKENVPTTGAFILSPVHRSNIDTPLAACVTRRRLRFLGKESMWKYRWSNWFFNAVGGIPVNRGTPDRQALRRCSAALAGGEPVVIFPEGTRKVGPVVENLFDGPAYLACKANIPIVPVGLGGSAQAMPIGVKSIRPVKTVVIVGEPMFPPPRTAGGSVSRRAVQEMTHDLQAEIQRLYDEAEGWLASRRSGRGRS